ncbi:MAG: serine/threonine-protein kinase [Treponema sp.]
MAQVPESIGKYRILSVVAVGGMGTVYKAIHPSLKRQVIIKKLSIRGNNAIRERFKREAQILLDLSSPYIVRMFDYFSEGRSDYIVLEFVDGMALDKLIEKQVSLPPQLALLIFLDACYGLKHAHAKGIVHRDIKPGNILISKKAEVKLADFGIASSEKESEIIEENTEGVGLLARGQAVSGQNNLTQAGVTLGTPAYMSPEQFDDSRSVDQRADIYSMGVMLYEMVTGSKPYPGDMAPETIARIKKGSYIAPKKLDKTLPHVVCSLIRKMMKPNPDHRYQTIEPVVKKIKRYLEKYDTHAVRIKLAQSIISPKTIDMPAFQPKKRPAFKAFLIILGAALFAGIFAFAWHEGFFYYTVLRKWFTPVTLSMKMPSTASADADLPARAFFFENDNNTIPEVGGTRRIFFYADEDGKQAANLTYKTKPVFLKPGNYRIKIAEGPYVWWKSVYVGKETKDIQLNFLQNAKRNLTIHALSIDYTTGVDLTSSTKFLISYKGEWVDLSSVDLSTITTGTVYKIRAVCDGYYEEYFSLRIDWYQDELFINSALRKK